MGTTYGKFDASVDWRNVFGLKAVLSGDKLWFMKKDRGESATGKGDLEAPPSVTEENFHFSWSKFSGERGTTSCIGAAII
jgi:hypothetical protein